MAPLQPIFKKAYWSLVAAGVAYAAFLLCMTNSWAQKVYVRLYFFSLTLTAFQRCVCQYYPYSHVDTRRECPGTLRLRQ